MEHLVTFTVSLDDNRIEEIVLKSAAKEVTKELTNRVEKILYRENYWDGKNLSDVVMHKLDLFMEKNKEDIIERAADKLTESLRRTKAVKEKTAQILDTV